MNTGRPKSILLIEDDEITNKMNSFLIEKKLKLTDNIKTVVHGKEAWDYISYQLAKKEKLPDLILLDINMPVMNGYEFIEATRAILKNKDIKPVIIMLTASSKDAERFSYGSYPEVKKVYVKPLTEKMMGEIIKDFFED